MNDFSVIGSILKKPGSSVFFSGIGGISMSAIAAALKQKGYSVSGSDIAHSNNTRMLEDDGIKITYGHLAKNVAGADLLVYNARIHQDNPEIIYAMENGIPVVSRAKMLGYLMRSYELPIGIAGTHGKSSTTSMTGEIFINAQLNPTLFIGAVYPPIGAAYKIDGDKYFIYEADEYSDSFLDFHSKIAVILNIEMDHPDYFKDISHIIESYKKYLSNMGPDGTAIINSDDAHFDKVTECYKGKIIRFGVRAETADVYCDNLNYRSGYASFDVIAYGEHYCKVSLSVPGAYNVYNALASAACAYACGIGGSTVSHALSGFKGAGRRFEHKGSFRGAELIEDYAHHPTELKALITAANKLEHNKVICIFQPHTYSRTKELLSGFTDALKLADSVVLTDIFSASEVNRFDISSEDLLIHLNNAVYIPEFNDIAVYLEKNANKGDLILIVGAGNINKLTDILTSF